MRNAFKRILAAIRAGDGTNHHDELTMSRSALEFYYTRGSEASLHRWLLPHELLKAPLTSIEVDELVDELRKALTRCDFSIPGKVAIVQMLGLGFDIESFEAVVRFLAQNGADLDDDSVFMALLGIKPSSFPKQHAKKIKEILEKHGTVTILRQFKQRKSDRVTALSRRLLTHLQRFHLTD